MCAASCTKARIPVRQTDTRKVPPAAASSQAMHRRAPPAAHTPRASRPPRDQNETTEACSSAANTPRGSSRATARPVPAPRRWRLVGSFAGVTEIRKLAAVIVVGERSHKISLRGLGIESNIHFEGGTGRGPRKLCVIKGTMKPSDPFFLTRTKQTSQKGDK